MQNGNIRAIAITISLVFSAGATALTMSKDQYHSAKRRLASEFDTGREACRSLSGNAIELCRAEAHRQYKVATAVLEVNYQPSRDGSYKARIAIADADYLVARRQCADQAAHVRNVCVRAARAIQIAAKADANALEDTSVMTRAANDRVDAARKALREADERMEVRNDTVTEKGNRDFQISEAKCEMLVDDARIECFKQAKKRLRRL
jgi:hypothetical protein